MLAASVNRRDFLRASSVGGISLVVGFYLGLPARSAEADVKSEGPFTPNGWIQIDRSGQITVLIEKTEIGQGIFTALSMIVAEELEADWSHVRVEHVPVTDAYQNMTTGGSHGIIRSWMPLRRAGAQAREMLIEAASKTWAVKRETCRAETSTVIHQPTGRRLTYGALVESVVQLPELNVEVVKLKDPRDFRLVGKRAERKDLPAKINGTASFGIDVKIPGMLYAVVARCPHFGGRLLKFDDTMARGVPAVADIFPIDPLPRYENTAGGVVVVAENTWAAIQARKKLKIQWDKGPRGDESSASLREAAQAQLSGPATFVAREDGDPDTALAATARKVEAWYELPFQAHATMEPMNCTIDLRPDTCEVWTGTQWPGVIQQQLSRLSGLPGQSIKVNCLWSGGAFGRRGQWDYTAEALQIAKKVKKPVKLIWTREDDMQHDFYRQLSYHHLVGGLDGQSLPSVWTHRIVSTSIREVFDSPEQLKDSRRGASQEMAGAADIPYFVPNFRNDFAPLPSAVPRAWWRSVESSFNTFVVECFLDELAYAAGKSPLDFRLALLREDRKVTSPMYTDQVCDTARLRTVLQLAAEKAGWYESMARPQGRGIACYFGFDTYVAHVAEVLVENGAVRVRRVVTAVDCGTAVNPDGVTAMIEGSVNFALTSILKGEITIKDGAVEQSNFHDYQVLRIDQAPEIEVHIVASAERPTGMGEPGVPPLAPAVANAVFAATGKRIRRLPIRAEDLK